MTQKAMTLRLEQSLYDRITQQAGKTPISRHIITTLETAHNDDTILIPISPKMIKRLDVLLPPDSIHLTREALVEYILNLYLTHHDKAAPQLIGSVQTEPPTTEPPATNPTTKPTILTRLKQRFTS
ncbi:MAG: hypothetical protein F4Y18_02775 [Cenarchaeum sp. SB0663_bin_5]|nr:hypothetical protein [Cenarchaeum sp. SB0663_bin_5]MYL11506.1 hypothetical protein [Cenarchaeum sp. SB0669_bin_11]